MFKTLKILTAVAVPASLLFAAGAAEARRPGKLLPRLVRQGALQKADLAGIKQIRGDLRACRKAVRSGAQPRGACMGKILEEAQARKALLEKALPGVQKPRMQKAVNRAIKQLTRRIGKLQSRMAKGAPAPAQMPAPPPAQ